MENRSVTKKIVHTQKIITIVYVHATDTRIETRDTVNTYINTQRHLHIRTQTLTTCQLQCQPCSFAIRINPRDINN